MSIVQEKLGDALDAEENFLLVPTPVGTTQRLNEGFLGRVVRAFPSVADRLRNGKGVGCGEVIFVGQTGNWLPAYTIALAGIHYREPNGWNEAPDMLRVVMDKIRREGPVDALKLATAGIPGTGLSGSHGKASNGVLEVLKNHPLPVVVYRNAYEGQSTQMREVEPPIEQLAEVAVPAAFAERHPNFSHTP